MSLSWMQPLQGDLSSEKRPGVSCLVRGETENKAGSLWGWGRASAWVWELLGQFSSCLSPEGDSNKHPCFSVSHRLLHAHTFQVPWQLTRSKDG